MPSDDTRRLAWAGELVERIAGPRPDEITGAEVDAIAKLAAAGLALRAAAMHPRDGAALGIVGSVTPQSALDAYDAAIRAALGTDADAGDVAGEAGT